MATALTFRRTRIEHSRTCATGMSSRTASQLAASTSVMRRPALIRRVLVHHEYVEPRSGLRTSGAAEAFDAAKTAFRDTFDKRRAWAAKIGFDSDVS